MSFFLVLPEYFNLKLFIIEYLKGIIWQMGFNSKDIFPPGRQHADSLNFQKGASLYNSQNQGTANESSTCKTARIFVLREISPGYYALKINGTPVNLRSDFPLEVGKTFSAPVLMENGKIKIYFDSGNSSFSGVNFNSYLFKNGIPDDALSRFILSFITNFGGKITSEKIVKARAFKKEFSKDTFEYPETSLFLEEAGINSTEEGVLEILNLSGEGHNPQNPHKGEYRDNKDKQEKDSGLNGDPGMESSFNFPAEKEMPDGQARGILGHLNYPESPEALMDETIKELRDLEAPGTGKGSLLTVLNHLTGKEISPRIIPFEIKSLNLKGVIVYIIDSRLKSVKEVYIKANVINNLETAFRWRFRIIPQKKPGRFEKNPMVPVIYSTKGTPLESCKSRYSILISTTPELSRNDKSEIIDFFNKYENLFFLVEFRNVIWDKNGGQNEENVEKIDIQV